MNITRYIFPLHLLRIDFWAGAGAAAIAGGASLLGGALSQSASAKSISDQMDFQLYMSNTAHQREVKDLIKAGLNPVLSAKYGGASTPSGASMEYENILGDAVSSAVQTRSANAAVRKMEAETANLPVQGYLMQAQGASADAQAASARAMAEKLHQEKSESAARTENYRKQNVILDQQEAASRIEAEIDNTKYGKFLRYLGRLNPFGSSAGQILRSLPK